MQQADRPIAIDWKDILQRYRRALGAAGNGLVLNPTTEGELVHRAYGIMDETLVALGYASLGPTDPFLNDLTGSKRAQQSVHPSASLQAAQIMFDTLLPALMEQLPDVDTPDGAVAVASALNDSIMHRVTFASVQYVDVLLQHLSVAHREERRHIARDLHDDVAHGIAAGIQRLELSQRQSRSYEGVDELIETAISVLRGTFDQVHELASELRTVLGPRSLAQGIRDHIADMGEQDVKVLFSSSGSEVEIASGSAEEIFLIFREAIMNCRKHARSATQIEVTLTWGTELLLLVADNGNGFRPEDVPRKSIGIWSMGERSAAIGATLVVNSVPGSGTRVELRMPLKGA